MYIDKDLWQGGEGKRVFADLGRPRLLRLCIRIGRAGPRRGGNVREKKNTKPQTTQKLTGMKSHRHPQWGAQGGWHPRGPQPPHPDTPRSQRPRARCRMGAAVQRLHRGMPGFWAASPPPPLLLPKQLWFTPLVIPILINNPPVGFGPLLAF